MPKGGEVLYEGKDIKKIGYSKFRNKYVSIVFQSYNLLPYMTALQNITTAMEITGTKVDNRKAYAMVMLNKVGINEKQAHQKVLTLSGLPAACIDCARLCCQFDLIVKDEPTGSLDEDTAKEIIALFLDLAHKEGKCVIVVTHDNNLSKVSDVNIRLSKGGITVSNTEKPVLV